MGTTRVPIYYCTKKSKQRGFTKVRDKLSNSGFLSKTIRELEIFKASSNKQVLGLDLKLKDAYGKDYDYNIYGGRNMFDFCDDMKIVYGRKAFQAENLVGRKLDAVFRKEEIVALWPRVYFRDLDKDFLHNIKWAVEEQINYYHTQKNQLEFLDYDFELENEKSRLNPDNNISICSSNEAGFKKLVNENGLGKSLFSIAIARETNNKELHLDLIKLLGNYKRISYRLNQMGKRMLKSMCDCEKTLNLEGQIVEVFIDYKTDKVIGMVPLSKEQIKNRKNSLEDNM